MNKFEIGTQWKTRGGRRAVVVAMYDDGSGFKAWHSEEGWTRAHSMDGSRIHPDDYDLIEPWSEPRKGEFWVNVYEDAHWTYRTEKAANHGGGTDRIACVKVNWTEGEGL